MRGKDYCLFPEKIVLPYMFSSMWVDAKSVSNLLWGILLDYIA
jgi:hypothetical protein